MSRRNKHKKGERLNAETNEQRYRALEVLRMRPVGRACQNQVDTRRLEMAICIRRS